MQTYFLLVAFLLFALFPLQIRAQEEVDEDATVSAEVVTPTPKVEYQLPYPGLLPGSPFYVLKTIRDRIVSFLIADPLKKAEFNLLQADKRLSTGIMLVKQKKEALAESTISKGINYFEEGIGQLDEARKQGINTDALAFRYQQAAAKHIEVLQGFSQLVAKEHQPLFLTLIKRMDTLRSRL
ncbi:MAG: hypothetical protein HY429_01835 [Candidatus Levybacteria bacterium]|nr:hypothetical protein [Candidatus Levybacteria bacterium]